MVVFLGIFASLEERLRTAEETLELERQQHRKSQEAQLAAGAGDEVSGERCQLGAKSILIIYIYCVYIYAQF